MIQRIQTVYLVLAGSVLVLLLLLEPQFATVMGNAGEFYLTPVSIGLTGEAGDSVVQSSFAIAAVLSFGLFLTIFSIMRYKNRKLQLRLVQFALLIQLVAFGVVFYYADVLGQIADGNAVNYNPVLGIIPFNVIFYLLAARGIKKDEALVRSADRLR